ncbi:MAG: tetratricopeptide repeat protein [Bacteroidales bacterium]|nr:tetratricopeptide repeat protein [Bacteroidales bacterium]
MRYRIFLILFVLYSNYYSQNKVEIIEDLLQKDLVDSAEVLINKSLMADSNNVKLLYYKAIIIQNSIQIDDSPEDKISNLNHVKYLFEKAYKVDPSNALNSILLDEYLNLAQQFNYTGIELFNKGAYTEAIIAFESNLVLYEYANASDLDTLVWYNLAMASEKNKQYNKAILYYNKILQHTSDWMPYIYIASIYKTNNNTSLFDSTLNVAIEQKPKFKLYFLNEFIAYNIEIENYNEALKYIHEAMQTDSLNPNLLFLEGASYQNANQPEKAIESYEKCLSIDSLNFDACYNLAAIYHNKAIDLSHKSKLNKIDKKNLKLYANQVLKYLKYLTLEEQSDPFVLKMKYNCYDILNNKKEKALIESKMKQSSDGM